MIYFFLAIGLISGFFYGWNDYRIYIYPHTDKFYKKYLKFLSKETKIARKGKGSKEIEIKLVYGPKKVPPVNIPARINTLWIHLVCAISGAMALYLILIKITSVCLRETIDRFQWQDFVVLLIGLLGITGLLPRTLWFFASKPDISGLIKK